MTPFFMTSITAFVEENSFKKSTKRENVYSSHLPGTFSGTIFAYFKIVFFFILLVNQMSIECYVMLSLVYKLLKMFFRRKQFREPDHLNVRNVFVRAHSCSGASHSFQEFQIPKVIDSIFIKLTFDVYDSVIFMSNHWES